ncbi:VirD4-like conjugal transfer protein, CD1115 family [Furfurilactobacillus entadae]|uniref:VirD4-like conjugal transfer protein, CD1115 family n=1 Tax=Furfurilactobacillus entadae TaxID=2922307 RepID=UPI0035E5141A
MSKAQRRLAAKERHSTSAKYVSPGLAGAILCVGLPVNLMAGLFILTVVFAAVQAGKNYLIMVSSHTPITWAWLDTFIGAFKWHAFVNTAVLSQHPVSGWVVEGAILIGTLILITRVWYRYRERNYGEYGDASFTELSELKRQYPKVPDRIKSFNGYGGVPVAHVLKRTNVAGILLAHKMDPEMLPKPVVGLAKLFPEAVARHQYAGYYYIDQDTVNTLIIGMTRSGKGETLVNVLVALLANARQQAAMVINDPKGELYQMAYTHLRTLGYNVQVLNLLDMNFSMSYNPLQVVIDFAQRGYYDKVQQYANSLATSVYSKPGSEANDKDKFWTNSSINLLTALILALVDYARRNDAWEMVTLRNCVKMMTNLGGQQVPVDFNGAPVDDPEAATSIKSKLSLYFESFLKMPHDRFRDMALDAFQQSNFAGDTTSGSIYSGTLEGLKLYQQEDVGQLTSKNSIDLTSVGFSRRLRLHFQTDHNGANPYRFHGANVNIYTVDGELIEQRNAIVDVADYIDYPIANELPEDFQVVVDFSNPHNPAAIQPSVIRLQAHKQYQHNGHLEVDPYDHQPVLKQITAQVQTEHLVSQIDAPEFTYSDRPTAIFMVTPPHNPAYNPLVAFFVDQLFNLNYEMAMLNGRKVFRRIHFVLDEFGNLPAINAMDTKVSIGLGSQMLFDIVVQNLEQLSNVYGKEKAATIQGNCGNIMYILTQSEQTAKNISTLLGKRTVNVNRLGSTVGKLDRMNNNVNAVGQDLLSIDELLNFKAGEMLVLRAAKRADEAQRLIESRPIYDVGRYSMPSRWMFMATEFDDSTTLADIPIRSPHQGLNLDEVTIDFEQAYGAVLTARTGTGELATPAIDIDEDAVTDRLFTTAQLGGNGQPGTISVADMIAIDQELSRTIAFQQGQVDAAQQDLLTTTRQEVEAVLKSTDASAFWQLPSHNSRSWLISLLGEAAFNGWLEHINHVVTIK